jgi:hypothetical protein
VIASTVVNESTEGENEKKSPALFLLCSLPTSVYPHGGAMASQAPNAASKPHRNNQAEDAVPNLFDTVRKDAKLHPLNRIRDRRELQHILGSFAKITQRACSLE